MKTSKGRNIVSPGTILTVAAVLMMLAANGTWAHGNVAPQEVKPSGIPVFGSEWVETSPFRDGAAYLGRAIEISASTWNLKSLEYEFLLIVRSPDDYGIDPYHARYYVFRLEDGAFVGEPKAADLNLFAAPPDDGVAWPITEAEFDLIEFESERFSRLVIR